mmetsp:Transcript_1326/g.3958  ORF Transcript_1326/g.3958 Transcript_1326/m.3958 type:complete len:388 (+) Transcript_1326:4917-6080(+)
MSLTFALPLSARSTLCGLRSRCTKPWECRKARPSPMSRATPHATSVGPSGPVKRMRATRGDGSEGAGGGSITSCRAAAQRSRARYTNWASRSRLKHRTTLGWSSVWMSALISVRASSAKRARSRLMATGRPSRLPSSTTVPPLPYPSTFVPTSMRPMRVTPGGSGARGETSSVSSTPSCPRLSLPRLSRPPPLLYRSADAATELCGVLLLSLRLDAPVRRRPGCRPLWRRDPRDPREFASASASASASLSLVELLVCSLVCVLVSLSVPAVDRLSGAAWAEAELEVNPPLPLPLRCLLRGRRFRLPPSANASLVARPICVESDTTSARTPLLRGSAWRCARSSANRVNSSAAAFFSLRLVMKVTASADAVPAMRATAVAISATTPVT